MNYKMIGKLISRILLMEVLFMVPALILEIVDGQNKAAKSFIITMLLILVIALLISYACRKATRGFYAREGLICVGLAWIVMSLLGCLPFYLSGQIPAYIDAFFEMVSGFTTTGASILSDVESLSRGILYWRSFSHWLGGMGVLVFILAMSNGNSQGGGSEMHLLRAESPGPAVSKLVPRTKQTASILYKLYIFITVLNVIFLLLGGMPWFDAICTAYGTAGTGGFGIRNDSIASYSPYLQNVCTVFMLLFGINFSVYYLILLKKFKTAIKDEELHLYLGITLASIIAIIINIRHLYGGLGETIRHAAFQVASIITTTGFATTDFDMWPAFSKTILLCLMIIGACAGSTGGGIKCARVVLLVKALLRNIKNNLFPQRVEVIRFNKQVISEKVIANTNAYLAAYIVILMISVLLVSLDGQTTGTNLSAVLACFNNIGPGIEAVGPTCNYSGFSILTKLVLIFDMLAGRLEIYPILTLFIAGTWKRK